VTASADIPTRITVIDNASDDPPSLRRDPTVDVITNPTNRGVAAARNQGTELGTAPFVLLLDSDAALRPGCLAALVDALEADRSIALAAPVFTDQTPEASGGQAPSPMRKIARGIGVTAQYCRVDRPAGADSWDVDFVIGACQLVRRSVWEALGGLDESYFYGPEDVDFCLRIRGLGLRIVQVADARCDHPPRRRHRSPLRAGGIRHARALLRHYTQGSGSPR
jgi:N-acetylglucosaminyl-diphospho-decaprenol L-rhamnosyltransferase